MIYLFLAEGFEEIEALTPVDMLRRAKISIETVGIGGKVITGARGISVTADIEAHQAKKDNLEGIILPGGPGTPNLEQDPVVQNFIAHCHENNLLIAAICAAPSILGHLGLLAGKTATAYPTFRDQLTGATVSEAAVERDGKIVTGRGMGSAVPFSAEIIKVLRDRLTAKRTLEEIQWLS